MAEPQRIRSVAREAIRKQPRLNQAYRASVGLIGGGTVALGVVLMPLPGPGSLIALGGLGILSSEFESAAKARRFAIKTGKAAIRQGKRFWESRSTR